MNAPHKFPIRVYFEDTDFTGIVYHANYLRFTERARTEMLRDLGFQQGAIHAGETGDTLYFVVARMHLEFLLPARMDDLLVVETRTVKVSAAVIELDQLVRRDDDILFTARVHIVALADGKARRLPREMREKLELSGRRDA
jgi:acyl-CoA thioester hydrolase